jgi:dsRNA-specific ribonuclease
MFHVNVVVNKNTAGKGVGKSKKIAEQNAAKDALSREGYFNE